MATRTYKKNALQGFSTIAPGRFQYRRRCPDILRPYFGQLEYTARFRAESPAEALEMALTHKETCEQLLQDARDAYSLVLAERLRKALPLAAITKIAGLT